MPDRYNPQEHIQKLEIAPRSENILDQREITIHSYQAAIPFSYAALNASLEKAWLTPQIRFGVFSRIPISDDKALSVVLGLQDELAIRAYDYDERRPLWYSWQNSVVDTINVHYFRDEDGLLRFTTAGGGRRITESLLDSFNSSFLEIPKDAVTKRLFDLGKLRDLCFNRFGDRLYKIRFSDPAAKEYRSIDHASFQSRKYIDASVERLIEIRADTKVTIESFESDADVTTLDLAVPIQVRFTIRGLSGSLKLSFPKIRYKDQLASAEQQAIVFYRLADATVNVILDADYYTHQRRSLNDLPSDLGMFRDVIELAPFREVLLRADACDTFFSQMDLFSNWKHWSPHLQAIGELIGMPSVAQCVQKNVDALCRRDPRMTTRLLDECRADHKIGKLGCCVAKSLASVLQEIPINLRQAAEESLLAWAVENDSESWDVDDATAVVSALGHQWRADDFSIEILASILWKLVGVIHARLMNTSGDCSALLRKLEWCRRVAENLPPNQPAFTGAIRLIASRRVPRNVQEARKILKSPVRDVRDLEESLLAQFGLPVWPCVAALRDNGAVVIKNEGLGTAISTSVRSTKHMSESGQSDGGGVDLAPAMTLATTLPATTQSVDVQFEKFGKTFIATISIEGEATVANESMLSIERSINRKRLLRQREFRKAIDPEESVVGGSPTLLAVFEEIQNANAMERSSHILILGEPGVGKTHMARLLHGSSKRSQKPFKAVNAGGAGGDITIQRGEWIGYAKGHGIQGIDKKGRAGHLGEVNGGTLFVDELDAMSRELQAIFLSVLEGRSVEKVGGESYTPDVRCVFATNADLDELVANKTLRQDLLDRITVKFRIPSLRERKGDILPLARHVLGDVTASERVLLAFLRYDWPGNVRELHGVVEAAMARMKSDESSRIELEHCRMPLEVTSLVMSMDGPEVNQTLWLTAQELARREGFEVGAGLQRRVAEIMGCQEPHVSRTLAALGLSRAESA